MLKSLIALFFTVLIWQGSFAQPCSLPGMTPSSAIPVCGTTPFRQEQVDNCSGSPIAIRGCTIAATSDRAFWYEFTCYQTGTLGFLISGLNASDDYDWCLFDITGRNPNDVFTNNTLQVSLNLYGVIGSEPGVPSNSPTGCQAGASADIHCEGSASGNSPFNQMPTIIQGREYLLMINNFSNSTAGYTLNFTGGTASITDPVLPALRGAATSCDNKQVRVKLNKKMKCLSLAPNGSDFAINDPGNNILSATGIGCSGGFDMDSVIITMANPIPPGTYSLSVKLGGDNNTLLDYCDRSVPVGNSVSFIVAALAPTPMDSLSKVGCAPNTLQLVFKKPMQCSSIATNGSDFIVTGPAPVTVVSASGSCASGLSSTIAVQLSAPLQLGGTYTIRLQTGTDGSTILDECGQQTPAGSAISFVVSDTVNANFSYNVLYGCQQNVVQYNHNGANGVNSWAWTFEGTATSSLQNPSITYRDFKPKNTSLAVTNGVCRDTASAILVFDNLLVAAFEGPEFACPNDPSIFLDKSEGSISSWEWFFGNGRTSSLKNPPPQSYPVPAVTRDEIVRLIIRNRFGCADTATQKIKVVNNCFIAVPSAFTPNSDGLNDYLYPLNAYKARDLSFSVYNRFGQRIFFTRNWTNKWDGRFKGQPAEPGTYVWVLHFINTDTNLKVEQKGTTILIR